MTNTGQATSGSDRPFEVEVWNYDSECWETVLRFEEEAAAIETCRDRYELVNETAIRSGMTPGALRVSICHVVLFEEN